jgi:hypothetical protein
MLVSSVNKRRMTPVPRTKRSHPPTGEGVWSTRVGARIELCLTSPLLGCWGCAPIVVDTRGETLSSHEESRHLTRNLKGSLAGEALSAAAYVPPCQGRPHRSSGCPEDRCGAEASDLRLMYALRSGSRARFQASPPLPRVFHPRAISLSAGPPHGDFRGHQRTGAESRRTCVPCRDARVSTARCPERPRRELIPQRLAAALMASA